jgi:hypothetical protein
VAKMKARFLVGFFFFVVLMLNVSMVSAVSKTIHLDAGEEKLKTLV